MKVGILDWMMTYTNVLINSLPSRSSWCQWWWLRVHYRPDLEEIRGGGD